MPHKPIGVAKMSPPGSAYLKQLDLAKEIATCSGRAKGIFGIDYLVRLTICVLLLFMPAMFVRWISGKFGYMSRKFSIEIYAILKPIFLYFVLFSGRANNKWWVLLTLWLFADLYLYLFGLVFLRRFYTVPASYGRSLLLLGINFCEAALAFAIFYTFSHSLFSNGHVVYAPIDMLYFSLVTASTVGFGDITVSSDTAKWLVIGQILSSLGFISLFVASFVAGFNDSEHA